MGPRPRLSYHAPTDVRYALLHLNPALRRESRTVARAQADAAYLERLRDERLAAMVRHARARVPFYRRCYDRDLVAAFRGVEDLSRLPLISRRDLQQKYRFVAASAVPERCFPYRTSGSTGEPVTVLKELDTLHYGSVVIGRIARRLGVRGRFAPHRTSLVNLMLTPKPRSHLMPALGFSRAYRFGLGEPTWDDPDAPLRFLSARSGFILASSPSLLLQLERHSLKHDPQQRHPIRPGFVLSSGAPLSEATRQVVAEFFACPVVDCYVTEELGIMAVECPSGSGFHAEALACLVECLRPDGSPAQPDEPGELVVTSLHSKCFPLIRYRIGDTGSLIGTPCGCGSVFPRIGRLIGRGGTVFLRRDGGEVAPAALGHELVGLPLLQHQIEQTALDSFTLRYVKAPGADMESTAAALGAVFESNFGPNIRLDLVACERIGEPGRKAMAYICNLSPPQK